MPNTARDIAMQGKLNMDQFQNRLSATKDNQLRTTMAGGAVPTGFAPKQVVAPKFENPDTMAEMVQETSWVVETAEAKRREVAERGKISPVAIGGALVIAFLFFS